MGIVPQCNVRDYWQAKNVITQTPAFHQVMSKNHLCAIWTHLHFSHNTKAVPGGASGYDRLFKIRQLIDTASSKFCTHYQAAKELSFDEMVIAFQGKSGQSEMWELEMLDQRRFSIHVQEATFCGRWGFFDEPGPSPISYHEPYTTWNLQQSVDCVNVFIRVHTLCQIIIPIWYFTYTAYRNLINITCNF